LLRVGRGVSLTALDGLDKRVDRAADSSGAPEREFDWESDKRAYEPPRLRAVGTLAELTWGVAGRSDGIGPGSAVGPSQPLAAP
jgi:hypothetical protein